MLFKERHRPVEQIPRFGIDLAAVATLIGGTTRVRLTPKTATPSYVQYEQPPLTIDGGAIRIGVSSHGVWEGKLSSDGLTLAGEWRQGSKTTPLVLRRTGTASEPATFSSSSPGTRGPVQR